MHEYGDRYISLYLQTDIRVFVSVIAYETKRSGELRGWLVDRKPVREAAGKGRGRRRPPKSRGSGRRRWQSKWSHYDFEINWGSRYQLIRPGPETAWIRSRASAFVELCFSLPRSRKRKESPFINGGRGNSDAPPHYSYLYLTKIKCNSYIAQTTSFFSHP